MQICMAYYKEHPIEEAYTNQGGQKYTPPAPPRRSQNTQSESRFNSSSHSDNSQPTSQTYNELYDYQRKLQHSLNKPLSSDRVSQASYPPFFEYNQQTTTGLKYTDQNLHDIEKELKQGGPSGFSQPSQPFIFHYGPEDDERYLQERHLRNF